MCSACVTKVNEDLRERLIKSLEFVNWKKQIKRDSTVFIKPNFTFPYYKEGVYTNPELPGIMQEFDTDNGVIYVRRPEDALKKAVELIENGTHKEQGLKARRFVENNSWDNITDEFERVLEEVIRSDVLSVCNKVK